jgi:glycosyltransferase involved in cell wall biosynthesis
VLPSDERGSGAPLEAMACGIPVVGADVGGLRWAIQSEVTGFLVPAGDPAAVAERLARFRRNPELGRAYGRAGFTWRHAADALARVYAAVLAPHHARLGTAASR